MTTRVRSRAFLVTLTATAIVATGVFEPTVTGQSGSTSTNGAKGSSTVKTAWGVPDLQGIWSNAEVVPFERLARYGARQFKTDEEFRLAQEALTKKNQLKFSEGTDSRKYRGNDIRGTEKDVARAYNEHFFGDNPDKVGRRTSMIIDPPDGRMPAYTPEEQKRRAEKREFLAALLQGTGGGRPGPISPRRIERSPDYNLDRLNRTDNPEDRSGPERCLQFALPVVMAAGPLTPDGRAAGSWGGVFRLVQGMDSVQIYYDVNQGWGFNRVIPITSRPHLPKDVHLYWGDAIGRWDGDTLVVDITNFSQESEFRGAREDLHVIERYKRLDPKTLQVMTTVEDPATWMRPFTFVQELSKNADQPNLVFESGCHEGNYGLLGMLVNTRAAEKLFAEGKGPDPATQDNATGGETDFRDIRDEF